MLVGALGSAEEDLRRHDTCTPAAMGVSGAPMTMGDGRMTRERAAKVTGIQVSDVESEGVRRGRRWGKGHNVTAR
jgi:hypothetical protein